MARSNPFDRFKKKPPMPADGIGGEGMPPEGGGKGFEQALANARKAPKKGKKKKGGR